MNSNGATVSGGASGRAKELCNARGDAAQVASKMKQARMAQKYPLHRLNVANCLFGRTGAKTEPALWAISGFPAGKRLQRNHSGTPYAGRGGCSATIPENKTEAPIADGDVAQGAPARGFPLLVGRNVANQGSVLACSLQGGTVSAAAARKVDRLAANFSPEVQLAASGRPFSLQQDKASSRIAHEGTDRADLQKPRGPNDGRAKAQTLARARRVGEGRAPRGHGAELRTNALRRISAYQQGEINKAVDSSPNRAKALGKARWRYCEHTRLRNRAGE